jgi:acyl-CoA dehydrogenase
MPTGEVSLRDAAGYPLGPVTEGFHIMTDMLNICRMHNSVAALALTRRVLWESAKWVAQRRTFGKPVDSYLLVQDLLCDLFSDLEAGLEVLFSIGLDFQTGGSDEETRGCLRLLTPLMKLNTARLAVRASSEAVELLGGTGFVEEYITARFYRDAQVLPVWEGTTNILYLDALRWVLKAKAHRAVCARMERLLAPAASTALGEVVTNLRQQIASLERGFEQLEQVPKEAAPLAVKRLCDALWPLYGLARLLPHAGNSYRIAAVVHRLLMKLSGTSAPLQANELPQAYQAIVRDACG